MISVAIIHCPRFGERVENVARLHAAIPHARVIADTGNAVAKRYNRVGCWPIARRAWIAASERYHLVLEDDAVLCSDFMGHVERLAGQLPRACISLFRGNIDCSVATLMPRYVISRWLSWVDSSPHGARHLPHHDYLITQGMRDLGIKHAHTEPSLVDHGPLPSLLDHSANRATRFEQSPSQVTFRPAS